MVVRHGITLAAVGAAAGLVLAASTSRVLQSLLFGIAPLDTATYVSIVE